MPRRYDYMDVNTALKQNKLEQENIKLARLQVEIAQEMKTLEPQEHTPYDEIPPPNDEEMQMVQDRLNALYNQIRTANEWKKREELLSYADDWP